LSQLVTYFMKVKKINQLIAVFFPSLLWATFIFVLSAQEMLPGLTLSTADFILKKTGHMFVYAVLYWLIVKGFKKSGYKFERIWLQALVICVIYAVTDELHQSTVPGRTATLRDIGYDLLGASLVFLSKFGYI